MPKRKEAHHEKIYPAVEKGMVIPYLVFGHRRKTGLFLLPGTAKNYQGDAERTAITN